MARFHVIFILLVQSCRATFDNKVAHLLQDYEKQTHLALLIGGPGKEVFGQWIVGERRDIQWWTALPMR